MIDLTLKLARFWIYSFSPVSLICVYKEKWWLLTYLASKTIFLFVHRVPETDTDSAAMLSG